MSSHTSSACKRVLSTGEVLRMIFEAASEAKDNAANARVCKAWSNEALNVLWRATEMEVAFNLLAPFLRGPDGVLRFTRRITHGDWARFDRYSWRVRTLYIEDCDEITPSALLEISTTRPRMDIFPCLVKISSIFLSPEKALLFCHPSVTRLRMDFEEVELRDFNMLLSYLPSKTPHLTSLEIESDDAASVKVDLEPTLRNLPSLTRLSVPCSWLPPRAIISLSSLPIKDVTILSFLTIPPWSDVTETKDRCKEALDAIGLSCPQIEKLRLETRRNLPPIPFSSIEPILSLSNLRHLNFIGLHSVDINVLTFPSIFQSLPLLVEFIMITPVHSPPLTLPLTILLDIIPFCNHLEILHIELDASLTQLPEINSKLVFPKLQDMNLESCAITDAITVATFLSMVLPLRCSLTCSNRSANDKSKWAMVRQLLPAFRRVKQLASA